MHANEILTLDDDFKNKAVVGKAAIKRSMQSKPI